MRRVFVATRDYTGQLAAGQQLRLNAFGPARLESAAPKALTQAATGGGLRIGQAVVSVGQSELVLATDIPRSYPLLWADTGDEIALVDHPSRLRECGVGPKLDSLAQEQFYSSGFVWGQRTLLQGVQQLQGGYTVRIDLADGATKRTLPSFQLPADERFSSAEQADSAFAAALDESMGAMVERLGSSRLVIPLSGGLDSRLLVAWLKNHGITNVLCFTYGVPGSKETEVSRRLAALGGFDWKVVELRRQAVRSAWAGRDAADFIEYAWGATALPHIQDWYAINALVKNGVIGGKQDVVLPGHTVIGNLHNEDRLLAGGVDLDELCSLLYAHHCALDRRLPESVRQSVRQEAAWIVEELANSGRYRGEQDRLLWADAVEMVNITERQPKYINNSMRAYEQAGLGWDMPMLDSPMWEFAGRISQELAYNRNWYRRYVERYFAAATGQEVPEHREQPISASTTAKIGQVLAALRVKKFLNNLYTAQFVMRHPLGFDMLIGDMPRPVFAAQMASGRHPLGIFARQLLSGRWNPQVDLGLQQD